MTQVVRALGTPAQLWVAREMIDRVVENSGSQAVISTAAWLVATMLVTRLAELAASSLLTLAPEYSAAQAVTAYLKVAATVDAGHFDDSSFLDRVRHAGDVADARFSSVVVNLMGLVGGVASLIGLAALLATISPLVTFLVVSSMVPWVYSEQKGFNIVRLARLALLPQRRKQAYLRTVVTDPEPALELLATGAGREVADRYARIASEVLRLERPSHRKQFYVIGLGGLAGSVVLAAAFVLAALAATRGEVSAGDVAAMVTGLAAFRITTSVLANSVSGLLAHGPYLADGARR